MINEQSIRMNNELFDLFVKEETLSKQQAEQFYTYCTLLLEYNKQVNLTAITDFTEVIWYHFQDSIKIRDYVDFSAITMIVDVGTGGGFPGIPLKVMFPHLTVILIEVNSKKIAFLEMVIKALNLTGISICSLDWRTFLRKTTYPVDMVVARASLAPAELIKMFKPGCYYHNATLVYWGSKQWKLAEQEKPIF